MHTYNTSQADIILKEYGRVVQNMVSHLKTIEDREKRNINAKIVIDLMKQLHPQMKEANVDYSQKLWDDLHCMSDFSLDVDSPYPKPDKVSFNARPRRVEYSQKEMKYKHYGRNVERLIDEAKKLTDPEERETAVIYICKLMKALYGAWNKEVIEEEVIIGHLKRMSNNELAIDAEKAKSELQMGMRLRKQSGQSIMKEGAQETRGSGGRDNRNNNNPRNNNNNRNNNNRNNNNNPRNNNTNNRNNNNRNNPK